MAPTDVFDRYARCYDLMYRDKDYAAEARFVHGALRRLRPGTASVLDLGCGTGVHAGLLAAGGCRVHGVDGSEVMLRRAGERRARLPEEVAGRLAFSPGDVRSVRLEERFDAVVSLFHVASYQPENADLRAFFVTAREHLLPGGVFLFDCWYGPAVLTDRPSVRVKRLEDGAIAVTRIAEPELFPNEDRVDVRYHVIVRDGASGAVEEFRETHRMRYLFRPEVADLLDGCGLALVECREWMSGREPGFDTWNVYFAARSPA
jgi:SAM-dependent methyltransferase